MVGKVAWIIGGGSGLGAAISRQLAERGWTVAISGRKRERLDQVAAANPAIRPYVLDVTDASGIEPAIAKIVHDLGRIDLFVFSVAAWAPARVADYELSAFEAVVDANFLGFVRVANPLVRQLEQQGGGELAVIASVAGYFGLPRSGAYNAAKAALISLLQTMKVELEPKGIRVRMVSPGFFKSELTAKNDFPMPFLLETEDAARRTIEGLLNSSRFEIAYPRRFVWMMKLMRMLPYPLFFAITRRTLPKSSG